MNDLPSADLPGLEIIDSNGPAENAQSIVRLDGAHRDKVIKRYGRKRSRWRQMFVQLGSWTFAGKSGSWAAARRDNERACIRLWRAHGFDTFESVEPDELGEATLAKIREAGPDVPFLALEYLPGGRLYDLLIAGDDEAAIERHLARFAAETSRRHALAMSLREPRLLHEHGSFRHVHVSGDRLLYFDFEISWTRRGDVEGLASREVATFLRSLGRASDASGRFRSRLETVIAHYEDRAQLRRLLDRQLRASTRISSALFGGRKKRRDRYGRSAALVEARELLAD